MRLLWAIQNAAWIGGRDILILQIFSRTQIEAHHRTQWGYYTVCLLNCSTLCKFIWCFILIFNFIVLLSIWLCFVVCLAWVFFWGFKFKCTVQCIKYTIHNLIYNTILYTAQAILGVLLLTILNIAMCSNTVYLWCIKYRNV